MTDLCVGRCWCVGSGNLAIRRPTDAVPPVPMESAMPMPAMPLSAMPLSAVPIPTVPMRTRCAGADHRPPSSGGSCACGMVTLVPARPRATGLRDVLARMLDDSSGEGGPAMDADRMLAALAAAGLTVSGPRLPV